MRKNLTLITEAVTQSVHFEGRRAQGVKFVQDGVERQVLASREVILCAGAVRTPQILELSGVGCPIRLESLGIPIVNPLPGVGENLQDHYVVGATFRLKPGTISINETSRGLPFVREAFKYLFQRKGLLTLSAAHIAAFVKSRPDLVSPDIQYHILPATVDTGKLAAEGSMELETAPGLTIAPCQVRPESRGWIRIKSPDPSVYPAIMPNYLSDPLDQEVIVAGLKWARKIANQKALAPYVQSELTPGDSVKTDAEFLAFARGAGATIYHPVGTCQMGHGPRAVVDPQLRVHGIEGLRVVDASIMPRLISGNTNAPTIMIAEKASDMILGRAAAA